MRLLLAVDLSDDPSALVDTAAAWAARVGGTLDLAAAESYPFGMSGADDPAIYAQFERQWAQIQEHNREAVEQALERVPEAIRGKTTVIEGAPDDALCALSIDYDGMVLATHGREGLRRLFQGSVSERVVRRSRCPVLVLGLDRPQAPGNGRLMYGVDLERDPPPAVFETLTRWARALDTRVDLVYIDPFQSATVLEGPKAPENWLKNLESARRHALEVFAKKLPEDVRGERLYRAGNAGASVSPLVELAAERDVAALVVCTHGRTGLSRLILGSVAERVVRTAEVPVLVLPWDAP